MKKGKKRKYNASFTSEDCAAIGRYAAENRNAAAVKKFKTSHDVGESTVRLFKKQYLDEIKKLENTGVSEVIIRSELAFIKNNVGCQTGVGRDCCKSKVINMTFGSDFERPVSSLSCWWARSALRSIHLLVGQVSVALSCSASV